MLKQKTLFNLILAAFVLLAACDPGTPTEVAQLAPTTTLAPNVSMTPRLTATPVPTVTPLPSDTPTPSDTPITPTPSDTPPPTPTPPITGIIASIQSVNVREGPGVSFSALVALNPGTGVLVLGQSEDSAWINIRMDDNSEGWVASSLLRLNPTPTVLPTSTPSPDLTALALGTSLPTAVIGGGTITPTPPRSVSTQPTGTPPTETLIPTNQSFLPIVTAVVNEDALNQTATALSRIAPTLLPPTEPPTSTTRPITSTPVPENSTAISTSATGSTSAANPTASFTPRAPTGPAAEQEGVDVLAYCDDTTFGIPAPSNLAAGSTIDVFWSWFATSRQQVQDHINAAVYEVRVDGVLLTNWQAYVGNIRQEGTNYAVYWYVPFNVPLEAGQHVISYRVTWTEAINDGYGSYGPGTANPVETGTCTFFVR